ncbi:MAG: GNAT family N-acetyltransferase [Erysipelothrix sp.]
MTRKQIRKCRVDDIRKLETLALDSKASWGYDSTYLEKCHDVFVLDSILDENQTSRLVEDGLIQGFYVIIHQDEKDVLDYLFVNRDCMGEGIGKILWDDMVSHMRANVLDIEADAHATGFYEKQGAVRVGNTTSSINQQLVPLLEYKKTD